MYLRDCTAGDVIEDVFVVTNKQLAATSTGKYFIKAYCSDRTAQLTARIWNATREMFRSMPDGGFLRIRGRVENYQNNLQLIIEQMWPAKEGTFDVADLLPHTERDIDQMSRRVFEMCGSIQNRHLAALVQAYLDDEELMSEILPGAGGDELSSCVHRGIAGAYAERDGSGGCGVQVLSEAEPGHCALRGFFCTTSPRRGS